MGSETTSEVVHCQCEKLSMIGALTFIPPNTVDPVSDLPLFLTVTDNPAVVLLITGILFAYLILMFWSVKADSRNKLKVFYYNTNKIDMFHTFNILTYSYIY